MFQLIILRSCLAFWLIANLAYLWFLEAFRDSVWVNATPLVSALFVGLGYAGSGLPLGSGHPVHPPGNHGKSAKTWLESGKIGSWNLSRAMNTTPTPMPQNALFAAITYASHYEVSYIAYIICTCTATRHESSALNPVYNVIICYMFHMDFHL